MTTPTGIHVWHFLPNDRRLQYGSRERVIPGVTLRVEGEPLLCRYGFHASQRILDALDYARGSILCRVVVGGVVVHGKDKLVGTERTVLWMADATAMLRHFACLQALNVAHLWDMPEVVRTYLQTENPRLRAAAHAAAQAVAASAQAAERAAAWTVAAATRRAVERAAARTVVAATRDVADTASWAVAATAWDLSAREARVAEQNAQLERMAWMLCGPETAQFPSNI